VTGDHADTLGGHLKWGKGSPVEQSFHIALIIRDPRQPQGFGRDVEAFTESIDLAPTILDWVGTAPAVAFNGTSLSPWIAGGTPDVWRDYAFAEMEFGDPTGPTRVQSHLGLDLSQANAAILREARWKYVHFNGGLPPLLFDLEADPGETRNLAEAPAHQAELLRLARKMLDHRMTHAHHALSRAAITDTGVVVG